MKLSLILDKVLSSINDPTIVNALARENTFQIIRVRVYIYLPTLAFAKAGAAPGTTGGVEPALS